MGRNRLARHPDAWAIGLIVLVAFSLRVPFFLNAPVFFEGDARGYLVRAVEIASGEGANFTLKRTPGYSLFIAAVFGVAGPSLEAVVLAQHLLGAASAIAVYAGARAIAGRAAGLLAGIATAISGSALIYEHVVLSETLFTFVLAAAVALVAIGLRRGAPNWLLAAGLSTGIGALVRPIGLAFVPVVILFSLWLLGYRRGFVASLWYLVAFGMVLGPWTLRNALAHGEAAPVHPGRFLIERTLKHNPSGVSMYTDRDAPEDSRLVRAGRRIIRDLEPEAPTSYEIHAALSRRLNLTDAQASELMWQLASGAIRRHPDLYLTGTWTQLGQLLLGENESVRDHMARRSAWRGRELDRLISGGRLQRLVPEALPDDAERLGRAEAIAHLYQPSSWILAILGASLVAVYWATRDSPRRLVLLPLAAAALLAVLTVAINGYLPRYRYPLDPPLHVAAAAGLVWTARLVQDKIRAIQGRQQPETSSAKPIPGSVPASAD